MTPVLQFFIALAGMAALFAACFAAARRIDNYGIVDVAWSHAFALLALFAATTAEGWPVRRWLLAAMVAIWSTRLGVHLFLRVASHHPREDGRYREMRDRWRVSFGMKMFGFFQIQALSVAILGLPMMIPMHNASADLHPLEWAGAALWLVGLAGESLADAQLRAFKRDPLRHGEVCTRGLWRCSRHPNYFFEWLVWVGYGVFAAASPWGLLGLIGPLVILYLLLRVTGVPPTEAHALRTKGDAYRRYQERTSAFFPWPPRPARVPSGSIHPVSPHP